MGAEEKYYNDEQAYTVKVRTLRSDVLWVHCGSRRCKKRSTEKKMVNIDQVIFHALRINNLIPSVFKNVQDRELPAERQF